MSANGRQGSDAENRINTASFVRLRLAGAPVEWFEYPDEGHIKRHPASKWWVYSRNLDWFRFWLKDEDPTTLSEAELRRAGEWPISKERTEQFAHWRALRKQWETAKAAVAKQPN